MFLAKVGGVAGGVVVIVLIVITVRSLSFLFLNPNLMIYLFILLRP